MEPVAVPQEDEFFGIAYNFILFAGSEIVTDSIEGDAVHPFSSVTNRL